MKKKPQSGTVNGDEDAPATKGDVNDLARIVSKAITSETTSLRTEFKSDLKSMETRLSNKLDTLTDVVTGLPERVTKLEEVTGLRSRK